MFDFVRHGRKFLFISGILLIISILALSIFGLKLGIDFKGGSTLQVAYPEEIPANSEIIERLRPLGLGEINIRSAGTNSVILRFAAVDEDVHRKILENLGDVQEERYESIGPVIGREASRKAKYAIILSLTAIILYVTWAFRKLSRVLRKGESWRYGIGATIALAHDVLILLGFFAILGHFRAVEINIYFVTAILTVLGYSVNDTIVIYDRIRENFLLHSSKDMIGTINLSLNETITRSLNTSLTTIFVLLAIYLFGGAAIQNFILAMIIGIITGTWSSIAIASQFLLFKRK
ncbi:protein translocase subunit SecF [Candidatus Parcubacteria bacterium 4484_255]|nr:MAG: protein translocase subunit SecF [Candidatus Parcubacteria bacterium 4484_255]